MAEEEKKDRKDEEAPAWFAEYAESMHKTHEGIIKRLESLEKFEKKEAAAEAVDKKDRKDYSKEEAEKSDRKDESAHEAGEELEDVKKKEEAEKKDRKDESKAEEEEKKEEVKADSARKDEEEKERMEKERADRARADATLMRENRELKARIDAMEHRVDTVYTEPSYEDRNALAAARSRADRAYQMVTGREASAPLPGESPIAYRKRMADGLRRFSPTFKEERVDSYSGAAFDLIENQIYADAQEASKAPDVLGPMALRPITRMDRGREVTEYQGDPTACWAPFMGFGNKVKLSKSH